MVFGEGDSSIQSNIKEAFSGSACLSIAQINRLLIPNLTSQSSMASTMAFWASAYGILDSKTVPVGFHDNSMYITFCSLDLSKCS
ncbi:hypothetical protein OGAPHI_006831 [Ogataea philodendri]|uniref:Uncharacterized protein n=1 Tax=Ogataea philodendri TaxID=1378263 RepID=A0A9P8NYJ4_9ASCO|nr:uncharacterized protein OGAPHI_006831 [Ogataea philodendri]KAH3661424.1 hypothetical protein OGAPHI_006831 [Ogataea philodendri]